MFINQVEIKQNFIAEQQKLQLFFQKAINTTDLDKQIQQQLACLVWLADEYCHYGMLAMMVQSIGLLSRTVFNLKSQVDASQLATAHNKQQVFAVNTLALSVAYLRASYANFLAHQACFDDMAELQPLVSLILGLAYLEHHAILQDTSGNKITKLQALRNLLLDEQQGPTAKCILQATLLRMLTLFSQFVLPEAYRNQAGDAVLRRAIVAASFEEFISGNVDNFHTAFELSTVTSEESQRLSAIARDIQLVENLAPEKLAIMQEGKITALHAEDLTKLEAEAKRVNKEEKRRRREVKRQQIQAEQTARDEAFAKAIAEEKKAGQEAIDAAYAEILTKIEKNYRDELAAAERDKQAAFNAIVENSLRDPFGIMSMNTRSYSVSVGGTWSSGDGMRFFTEASEFRGGQLVRTARQHYIPAVEERRRIQQVMQRAADYRVIDDAIARSREHLTNRVQEQKQFLLKIARELTYLDADEVTGNIASNLTLPALLSREAAAMSQLNIAEPTLDSAGPSEFKPNDFRQHLRDMYNEMNAERFSCSSLYGELESKGMQIVDPAALWDLPLRILNGSQNFDAHVFRSEIGNETTDANQRLSAAFQHAYSASELYSRLHGAFLCSAENAIELKKQATREQWSPEQFTTAVKQKTVEVFDRDPKLTTLLNSGSKEANRTTFAQAMNELGEIYVMNEGHSFSTEGIDFTLDVDLPEAHITSSEVTLEKNVTVKKSGKAYGMIIGGRYNFFGPVFYASQETSITASTAKKEISAQASYLAQAGLTLLKLKGHYASLQVDVFQAQISADWGLSAKDAVAGNMAAPKAAFDGSIDLGLTTRIDGPTIAMGLTNIGPCFAGLCYTCDAKVQATQYSAQYKLKAGSPNEGRANFGIKTHVRKIDLKGQLHCGIHPDDADDAGPASPRP